VRNRRAVYNRSREELLSFAQEARECPTVAEAFMWEALKGRRLDVKVRQQNPIFGFIADFWIPSASLAIEIDGGYHNDPIQRDLDQRRDSKLAARGVSVLRFTSNQVLKNRSSVLATIASHIAASRADTRDMPRTARAARSTGQSARPARDRRRRLGPPPSPASTRPGVPLPVE
jgi:leucyl-tRNA synthetase